MKLLPPKPPKPEGTEKIAKKKIEEKDSVGGALSDIPDVLEVPEALEVPEISDVTESAELPDEKTSKDAIIKDNSDSFVRIDKYDKKNLSADNFIQDNMPPDVPEDDLLPPEVTENQGLDQKVATVANISGNGGEKKKGFFSKLFVKKEKAPKNKDKKEVASVPIEPKKEEFQDEIQKFEDADNNLDELSKVLENSIGNAESIDKLTAVDEALVPEPIQEKQPVASKYVLGKSWDDEINELPDVGVPIVQDDKKYRKDNFVDYVKESSKVSKKEKIKEIKKEDKKQEIQEINLEKDWAANSDEVLKEDEKKDKSSKKDSKLEKAEEKKSRNVKIEEINPYEEDFKEEFPKVDVKEEPVTQSVKSADVDDAALSGEINNWKSKSILIATTKDKPDKKTMQQINVKLRKVLKIYENKLLNIAANKKKSILLDIKRINRKEAELDKKEKATRSKESMLMSLENSLNERKTELDILVSQEASLYAKKESLKNEIAELKKNSAKILEDQEAALAAKKESVQNELAEFRKKSTELKTEIINNQKLFDSQKRTIMQETKNLQDGLKNLKDSFNTEKRKGDKKLVELAKKVEEAQLQMDEMAKKSRKVAVQLKAKEDALHQKEKEVLELISQEKKILALLKGNEDKGLTTEDIKARRRARERKPATVIGFGGEPELYVDDEDTLNQRIHECKELIKESNYEDAKTVYNKIRDEFMSAVLEDSSRKTIRHEIRELYDEIALKMISHK